MHSHICLGAFILGLAGCGVFGSADTPSPPAGDPAMADVDGGLPEGAPPASVGTPDNNELTNEFGVFVTTNGTADGDGTKEHPLASIAAGIERVKDLKLRVYVCGGTYKESLTLVNAVSVIGSLGCDGGVWKTGGARTVLEAPTSPAVRAKDIALATRFEGFDVTAPAGTATSPSSIALIAENATMLTIANARLTSAKAFDGVDGTDGVQLTLGAAATGKPGTPFDGQELLPNPLTGPVRHVGQAAGIGSCAGAAGHDGAMGTKGGNADTLVCTKRKEPGTSPPVYFYGWQVFTGQTRSDALPSPGTAGAAGNDGKSAASSSAFSTDGYAPAGGTAGSDGSPGVGGNGGDGAQQSNVSCTAPEEGKYLYDASGPGGGAGGCPGLAGTPGGGGGASVAALVFNSPGLSLVTTELVAGNGGNGGKGAFGSTPTVGGGPGLANGSGAGTAGGAGGRAGFSGSGAGAPSIALAYTGGAVVVAQDTHTTAGTGGTGVPERPRADALGNNVAIPMSASGPAMPTFAF